MARFLKTALTWLASLAVLACLAGAIQFTAGCEPEGQLIPMSPAIPWHPEWQTMRRLTPP